MTTSRKVGGMILIIIIYFVFDTLLQAGFFKSISNEFNGTEVQVYRGIWGGEDIEWDRANNLIYISFFPLQIAIPRQHFPYFHLT